MNRLPGEQNGVQEANGWGIVFHKTQFLVHPYDEPMKSIQ